MILHSFGKIVHFDVDLTVVGGVLISAECLPDIPPIETYTKESRIGQLWPSKTQGTAAPTSSDLRSFLPKTVKFTNDRGKRVSADHRGAGAKIAFLKEYTRDLVV